MRSALRPGPLKAGTRFAVRGSSPTAFIGLGSLSNQVAGAPLWQDCDGGLYAKPGDASFTQSANGYRIPNLIQATNGTLLAFGEGRTDKSQDVTTVVIAVKTSTDSGRTWSAPYTVAAETTSPSTFTVSNCCPCVNPATGRIHVVFYRNSQGSPSAANNSIWWTKSDDHGATWSAPVDITSSVRVHTGGTLPAGHAWPATDWVQTIPGPHAGVYKTRAPNAGRIVFSGYHRLIAGSTAYPHVFWSDDDGTTWTLGYGPDPAVGGNNDLIEPAIIELNSGVLLINCRNRSGASVKRKQSTSSDGGSTWTNAADVSQMDDPATGAGDGCQGSICRGPDGRLLLFAPNDTGTRTNLCAFQSADEGTTWSVGKTLFPCWSAYSASLTVGSETLIAFEGGHGGAGAGADSWAKGIYLARLNKAWLDSTDPAVYEWNFNEFDSALPAITGESDVDNGGCSIRDVGSGNINYNVRIHPRDASDLATYGAGYGTGVGLVLDAGTDHVRISLNEHDWIAPLGDESVTYELRFKCTGTSTTILATGTSGARVTITIDASGKLAFLCHDGTNSATITSTAVVNDDSWYTASLRRNAVTDKLEMIVGGTAETPVTDTTTANTLRGTQDRYLGSSDGSASQWAGTLDVLRITRGLVSDSNLLSPTYTKSATQSVSMPSGAPNSISGCKLWLPGYYPSSATMPGVFFGDFYGSQPLPPYSYSKQGYSGVRDLGSLRARWKGIRTDPDIAGRLSTLERDAVVGSFHRFKSAADTATTGGHYLQRAAITTDYDFVHQDNATGSGAFTISFAFMRSSLTTSVQMIWDNINGTGTNDGFYIYISNANPGNITFNIENGVTTYSQNSGLVISSGSWYHVLLYSAGNGAAVNWRVTEISGNTTIAAAVARGTAPSLAANPSDQIPTIGSYSNGANGAFKGGMVDLCIFNEVVSDANQQVLFDWTKNGPNRT